jgi:hypothetical protein
LDTFCLDTPPSLLPGKYRLNLAKPAQTDSSVETVTLGTVVIQGKLQTDQSESICQRLNSTKMPRRYGSPPPDHAKAVFNQFAILQGYELSLQPNEAGLQAQFIFHWQSLMNNPPAAQPTLRLVDKAQTKTVSEFTWTPGWGFQPTEFWFKDELITDTTLFSMPKLPPGKYSVVLEWRKKADRQLVETLAGQSEIILKEFSIP